MYDMCVHVAYAIVYLNMHVYVHMHESCVCKSTCIHGYAHEVICTNSKY